jgi:hypothetical protein
MAYKSIGYRHGYEHTEDKSDGSTSAAAHPPDIVSATSPDPRIVDEGNPEEPEYEGRSGGSERFDTRAIQKLCLETPAVNPEQRLAESSELIRLAMSAEIRQRILTDLDALDSLTDDEKSIVLLPSNLQR